MKKTLFLVLVLFAVPALGQNTEEAESKETTTQAEDTRPGGTSIFDQMRERIRRAIRLPRTAQESRDDGVPENRVRELLRTARERRIPAGDAQEILEVENAAIRAGADKDNFGAVVQRLKEGGLRGRELAAAIHAEQVARGMKKPGQKAHGKAGPDAGGKAKGKGDARKGGGR